MHRGPPHSNDAPEEFGPAPSQLLMDWREALRDAAGRGPLLDLACGAGRNALAAARWDLPVVGIDRDPAALGRLRRSAASTGLDLSCVRADLETGRGIPVRAGSCGAVLVFRFLYRPLSEAIVEALAPGGLLLYETFMIYQRELGQGPDNPAFLLDPGELPSLFPGLEILTFEELSLEDPWPQALARLVARKPGPG